MAGSINKVILVGNLGRDPEIRSMQSGDRVANLAIATSETWKDKQGNRQERTEWHNVVIFNPNLVDVAERYLRKGGKVYIEGQLQTRKWQDREGVEKYTTEVVLRPYRGELALLDRPPSGAGGGYESDRGGYDRGDRAPAPASSGRSQPAPAFGGDLDDEIPF